MIDNVAIVNSDTLWDMIHTSKEVEKGLREVAEEMDGMTTEVYFSVCANYLRRKADALVSARAGLAREVNNDIG